MKDSAIFGDVNGRSTDVDLGKDLTPYRYVLTRGGLLAASHRPRPLVVIGTNPSTATAETNDPTIRRDMGFAKSWGYGLLVKVNLHGWRDVDPSNMEAVRKSGRDVVGVDNAMHVTMALRLAWLCDGLVLCAWGKNATRDRVSEFTALVRQALEEMTSLEALVAPSDLLHCIKTNADGSPIHTLYQPGASKPIPWVWQS